MTTAIQTFHIEQSLDTAAAPENIWALFRDVLGWPNWNAGIERMTIEGPFAQGTWFTMKPPEQEVLRSQLIEVREGAGFTDETQVGELVIRVSHRIERLGPELTRITYALEAVGPEAAEVGPAIASDFPQVLKSLAARATRQLETRS